MVIIILVKKTYFSALFTLSFLSSSMDPMMSHKSLLKVQKNSKHYFDYAIKNVPSQKIVHSGRFVRGVVCVVIGNIINQSCTVKYSIFISR